MFVILVFIFNEFKFRYVDYNSSVFIDFFFLFEINLYLSSWVLDMWVYGNILNYYLLIIIDFFCMDGFFISKGFILVVLGNVKVVFLLLSLI